MRKLSLAALYAASSAVCVALPDKTCPTLPGTIALVSFQPPALQPDPGMILQIATESLKSIDSLAICSAQPPSEIGIEILSKDKVLHSRTFKLSGKQAQGLPRDKEQWIFSPSKSEAQQLEKHRKKGDSIRIWVKERDGKYSKPLLAIPGDETDKDNKKKRDTARPLGPAASPHHSGLMGTSRRNVEGLSFRNSRPAGLTRLFVLREVHRH